MEPYMEPRKVGTIQLSQTVEVYLSRYQADVEVPALLLRCLDGSTYGVATHNIYPIFPQPGFCFIKDPCDEITKALVAEGIVEDTGVDVPYGPFDAMVRECKLLVT